MNIFIVMGLLLKFTDGKILHMNNELKKKINFYFLSNGRIILITIIFLKLK